MSANYRLELDLDQGRRDNALHRCGARSGRAKSSAPRRAMSSSRASNALSPSRSPSGSTVLRTARPSAIGNDRLVMTGAARPVKPTTDPATQERQVGVAFRAEVKAIAEGGAVRAADNTLRIENARAVTLLLTAATDFREHDAAGMAAACARNLRSAAARSYNQLRAEHVADYRRYASRANLRLLDGPDPLRDSPPTSAWSASRTAAEDPRASSPHTFTSAATCSSAAAVRARCRPICKASGTRASIRRGDRSSPSTSTPK